MSTSIEINLPPEVIIDRILDDFDANTLTLETFNDYNNLWR